MGCIYAITNKENGKQYIGQSIKSAAARFKQHVSEARGNRAGSRCLNAAINKYGFEKFDVQVLTDNINSSDELNQLEAEYIRTLNTLVPNGYNIQFGGQSTGRYHCEDSKELMRQQKLGEKNHNYGKPRSDIAKANISKAKAGENHHFYGKTFSQEHKLKLSQSHKKYDTTLPMYIAFVRPRPDHSGSGYVVTNPSTKTKKYFTSTKFSMEEKLQQACDLLDSFNIG
jgi:group I intron endonuclease